MMKISRIILLILLLLPAITFAQKKAKVDSLLRIVQTGNDTSKVNALNKLSLEYRGPDPAKALDYATQALNLSEKIGFVRGTAASHSNVGEMLFRQGKLDEALHHDSLALRTYEETNNKSGIADCYNSIAGVYYIKGDYPQVLEFLLKAIHIKEEQKDTKGLSGLYSNIAIIYYRQGALTKNKRDLEKSMDYNMKALAMKQALKDTSGMATSYSNIGLVYMEMKNDSLGLLYQKKSLVIRTAENEKSGMGVCYSNIGNIFYNRWQGSKNKAWLDSALLYQQRALQLHMETGNKSGIAGCYNNIGSIYQELGNYREAIVFQQKTIEVAREIGQKEILCNAYNNISASYAKLDDYKNAYEYHVMFKDLRDSVVNEEKNQLLTDMDAKYEAEKKEKEIALLNKEKEISNAEIKQQSIVRNFLFGVVGLAIVFGLVLLNAYRNKQKANELLNLQKQQIEHQKQEITDSITYARNIQQALLPPRKEIMAVLPGTFVLYRPKDIVSGDFYWFCPPGNDRDITLLAAADCTGHGVPGAFMSMIGVEKLNEIVKLTAVPGQMLAALNLEVKKALRQSGEGKTRDGMDIVLIAIDKAARKLWYAGANRPLYIVKQESSSSPATHPSSLIEIKPTKAAIGGHTTDDQEFETHEVLLDAGDMIYLCSDGFADQFGGDTGKKLMTGKFRELLVSAAPKPVHEQEAWLERFFNEWKKDYEQVDDVLVMGIRT